MRIATWNVERLRHKRELDRILIACSQVNADILVLTETDTRLKPCYQTVVQTPMLSEIAPEYYSYLDEPLKAVLRRWRQFVK